MGNLEIRLNTGWNANIREPYVLVAEDGTVRGQGHECQCQDEDCHEIVSCGGDCRSMFHICPACYMNGHMAEFDPHWGPMYLLRHGASPVPPTRPEGRHCEACECDGSYCKSEHHPCVTCETAQ